MVEEFIVLQNIVANQDISTSIHQQEHSQLDIIGGKSIATCTDTCNKEIKSVNKRKSINLRVCVFGIFICVVTIIGVIIVCEIAPKRKNGTCKVNFIRSAQIADEYDSHPRDIAVGDLNYDGYQDLVVANSGTDNIGVFIGYGNGTFNQQMTYSTNIGSHPYAVIIDHVNNDTLLDIIVANYGINSIGVFLGIRNENFSDQTLTSLGPAHPISIASSDFNHDHQLDLVVANYGTSNIAILLGFNNGSFYFDRLYDMGYDSIPYSVIVCDVNYDNKTDIIIVNYGTNQLVTLLANQNGDFVKQIYSTGYGTYPSSVNVGDVNNDKIIDIIVTNSGSSSIGIFLGNGNGTFQNIITYSTGVNSHPQSLVVADFDNDTYLDVVIVDPQYDNIIGLKGDTDGTFLTSMRHSIGYKSNPYAIVVSDFDNDNQWDIATADRGTNDVVVYTSFNIYPVTNQTIHSTGTNSEPYYVDVADLNKDGYLDIIVTNCGTVNIDILMNLGNGTFAKQRKYYMGESSWPYYTAIGDLNNDTHLDIVVALKGINQIGILLGDGNGFFEYGDRYSTGSNSLPYTVAIGDLNRDGNLDIITSNYNTGNIGLFFGYGNGTFTNMTKLLDNIGYAPKCVGVADFNNDSILDIAASNSGTTGGIAVLLGYGNGSFQIPLFTSTQGDLPNCFTIGDLNSDLQPDIVYTDTLYSHVGVLLGSGNGTFNSLTQYLSVRSAKSWYVALGYYDDDPFIDIAVSCAYDSSINIYLGTGNGSFETPFPLYTGFDAWTWSVQFGDFNNDDQQDIVAGNDNTNNIVIFYVHYNANFLNQTRYTTGSGSHPYAVTVNDLNNDGQSDIIVANAGNNNIRLLGDYHRGSFSKQVSLPTGTGSHPQDVRLGDFNKDNISDIVVANGWSNNIDVFIGHDNGSFDRGIVYSTGAGSSPTSIGIGDLNNDDRMDIVIANEGTNNVAVFLAFDYVIFTTQLVYVPGLLPQSFAVVTGDFNNDDRLDLAVINRGVSILGIYLGNSDGTFSTQISHSTGSLSAPSSLAIGDFNNDNYLDIVVANTGANNLMIFLGYGNGSFQSPSSSPIAVLYSPISVAVADFNNDSRSDIVVANQYSDDIWIFLGYGNGSFEREGVYSMSHGSLPQWVVVGDLNNDTLVDIVVANYNANNIYILLGYGNGSFGQLISPLSAEYGSEPCSIALGDLNKDGLLDIIVAYRLTQTISIFFGDIHMTYSLQKIYPVSTDSYLYVVVVTDMNHDDIPDIIASDYNKTNSSFAIWYGFGNGDFTLPKIYPTAINSWPSSIASGDFNNDSKVDLAVIYSNQATIAIKLQINYEPFASSLFFSTGNQSHPKSISIGDFNNDNLRDIAVANYGTNNIGILFGYGNGHFSNASTYSTGIDSHPSSLTIGYINNDSYLDIAVVNSASNNLGIFLGNIDGISDNMIIHSTGHSSVPSSVFISDLNEDNYQDIVVTNWGINTILVYFGLGHGNLSEPNSYSVGYNAHPISITIGDMNHDTKLDLIVANYDGNYVEIFLQIC